MRDEKQTTGPQGDTDNISTHKVRVIYGDTDQMGVVYHGMYLRWFEAGRTHYMRCRGVSYAEMETQGVFLPVVEAHVEYLKPARFDEVLDVVTRATDASRVQVRFEYAIFKDGQQLVRGYTRHAAVSPAGRPIRLPEHVKEALFSDPTVDDFMPY